MPSSAWPVSCSDDDAGVLELGRAAGLAQEPGCVLVAGQAARPRDLDRHDPAQLGIARPEHVAERAGAEPLRAARTCPAAGRLPRPRARPPRRVARPARTDRRDQLRGHRLRLPTPSVVVNRRKPGEQGVGERIERLQRRLASRATLDVVGDPRRIGSGRPPTANPSSSARPGQFAVSMDRPLDQRLVAIRERGGVTRPALGFGVAATSIIDYPVARVSQPALAPAVGAGHEQLRSAPFRATEDRSPPPRPRGACWSAFKADDPAAWDRLVDLYAPLVYRWCRRWDLPEQEIADVFQDVFQAVATHIARLPQRTRRRHVPRLAPDDHPEQGARPFPQARAGAGRSGRDRRPDPVRAASRRQSPDEDDSGATDGTPSGGSSARPRPDPRRVRGAHLAGVLANHRRWPRRPAKSRSSSE